jgi:Bacterial capsule synthesis protein PGA_cap
MNRKLYTLFTLGLIVLGTVVIYESVVRVGALTIPNKQYGLLALRFDEGTLLFGPDVMLGRAVETLMDEEGSTVPFEHIRDIVMRHDVSVVNFEASVPEEHVPTASFGMQFSVKDEYLGAMRDAGFDVLSLANNHARDYGEAGYTHTVTTCEEYGLLCVGHPTHVGTSSIMTTDIGDTTVSVLMLHTLFSEPSTTTLMALLTKMREESDIQYAFVHWGDEYTHIHNAAQEYLAHFLIDNGIDAVIGHHPHVVQDVEEYQGKPIFYSLGNLIFDQFWNTEVQEGYLLSIRFEKRHITYELLPYDMLEKRSVPKPKTGDGRTTALLELLPSSLFTNGERMTGTIRYEK